MDKGSSIINKASFNVTKTSKGWMIEGIDVKGIILEVHKKDDILKYILSALDVYIETQHDEWSKKENFKITISL